MSLPLMFWYRMNKSRDFLPLTAGAELHIAHDGLESGAVYVVGEFALIDTPTSATASIVGILR
jgi:hypothetical protein